MRGATCPDCNKPLKNCTCHQDTLFGMLDQPVGGEPSNRAKEWQGFSGLVHSHIEDYTVVQYGDAPNDQAAGWTAHDVEQQIKKYTNRMGNGARGFDESQRDLLKIAHYCAILYNKRQEAENGVPACGGNGS